MGPWTHSLGKEAGKEKTKQGKRRANAYSKKEKKKKTKYVEYKSPFAQVLNGWVETAAARTARKCLTLVFLVQSLDLSPLSDDIGSLVFLVGGQIRFFYLLLRRAGRLGR
ncbi:hypothetical protein OUZ56_001478 [Daphnia magna]|uniref:Uncharacterized protein n=1 Tax=Daphnia magna TaxID=35525 RepID=A0ABR0A2S2_9CRUS|nr:hypothetical protein OUZ56_001478 [Daphnia magna]